MALLQHPDDIDALMYALNELRSLMVAADRCSVGAFTKASIHDPVRRQNGYGQRRGAWKRASGLSNRILSGLQGDPVREGGSAGRSDGPTAISLLHLNRQWVSDLEKALTMMTPTIMKASPMTAVQIQGLPEDQPAYQSSTNAQAAPYGRRAHGNGFQRVRQEVERRHVADGHEHDGDELGELLTLQERGAVTSKAMASPSAPKAATVWFMAPLRERDVAVVCRCAREVFAGPSLIHGLASGEHLLYLTKLTFGSQQQQESRGPGTASARGIIDSFLRRVSTISVPRGSVRPIRGDRVSRRAVHRPTSGPEASAFAPGTARMWGRTPAARHYHEKSVDEECRGCSVLQLKWEHQQTRLAHAFESCSLGRKAESGSLRSGR